MIRTAVAWGPAVFWAAVLLSLSSLQAVPQSVWFAANDKVVHFVLYAVLGLTLGWGGRYSGKAWMRRWVLVVGLAYGALDEVYQSFVPNRIPSLGDYVADVLGVLVGYFVLVGVWTVITRGRVVPDTPVE